MNRLHIFAFLLLILSGISIASAEEPCVNCHKSVTPGIVSDFQRSKMAEKGVTCLDCHKGMENDPSVVNHNGYKITPVVSPRYCERCHPRQVAEFERSKHAWTVFIGPLKPWYKEMKSQGKDPLNLQTAIKNDPYEYIQSQVTPLFPASGILNRTGLGEEITGYKSILHCFGCHGSYVIVKNGKITKGWPNNGVGRINPDGSLGSCSSCHTRHKFSIAEARKPETCGQCHLGPDHPQIEIYEESKHGNIYFSLENRSFLEASTLTPENTPAPTCAVCHMSGFNGVPATHDVGDRLYWELQPKISTPQWYPSSAVPEGKAKPDETKALENRNRMKQVCMGCHSPNWVEMFFTEFDNAVRDYNKVSASAKELLDKIYAEGYADPSNPIDEFPELMYYYMWHHDGRRWRMGASMMGYDFSHWHGLADMVMDKYLRLLDWYETQKKINAAETVSKETQKTPGFSVIAGVIAIASIVAVSMLKKKK